MSTYAHAITLTTRWCACGQVAAVVSDLDQAHRCGRCERFYLSVAQLGRTA